MYDEKELKWFDRFKVKRPEHYRHELEDSKDNPLHLQLPKLKCWGWHRDADGMLACMTEHGKLAQYLSPEYIVMGDGDNGLPLLRKVV